RPCSPSAAGTSASRRPGSPDPGGCRCRSPAPFPRSPGSPRCGGESAPRRAPGRGTFRRGPPAERRPPTAGRAPRSSLRLPAAQDPDLRGEGERLAIDLEKRFPKHGGITGGGRGEATDQLAAALLHRLEAPARVAEVLRRRGDVEEATGAGRDV